MDAKERMRKCRDHAEQCKAWAELADDPKVKQHFLRLAAEWKELAGEIDDIERMRNFVAAARR